MSRLAQVLNDYTLGKPSVDRSNRFRQRILAMEKRFVTNDFAFRFFTYIIGQLMVNSYFWVHMQTSINDFKGELSKLAVILMHNDHLAEETAEKKRVDIEMGVPVPHPRAERKTSVQALSPRSRSRVLAQAHLGPDAPELHQLVPIRVLTGYQGGKQQRCIICGFHVSWCCSLCSTADSVAAMHPPVMGKGLHKLYWGCLKYHQQHPNEAPKGNVDFQSRLKRCKAHTGAGSSTDPLPAW